MFSKRGTTFRFEASDLVNNKKFSNHVGQEDGAEREKVKYELATNLLE
jgi:hypothetical protein